LSLALKEISVIPIVKEAMDEATFMNGMFLAQTFMITFLMRMSAGHFSRVRTPVRPCEGYAAGESNADGEGNAAGEGNADGEGNAMGEGAVSPPPAPCRASRAALAGVKNAVAAARGGCLVASS
jgi:hypothetical protein